MWAVVAGIAFAVNAVVPRFSELPSGMSVLELVGLVTAVLALTDLGIFASQLTLARQHKPVVEGTMLGRIYQLLAGLIVVLGLAYAFGQLTAFGTFLSLFGGMLLGW